MIMVCMCLGQAFVMVGLPQRISEGIMSISNNKYMILLLLNILFIIMGMLVSDMVTIILVVPLILPLVLSTGIDIIHFASIVGVNLAMGNVTPPYATGLYLGIKLGNSTFADVMKTVVILLFFAYFPVLIIVNLVPSIPLSLPRLLGLV